MPDKTLIDVLDTAVKIGLGALISGVSTFWITKQKERADSAKEYEGRHRTILEQVAEETEQVNHIYLKYWALVVEWFRYKKQGSPWPDSRKEELERTKSELFHAFKSMTSAEAKLLLVNEKEASEALRKYGEAVVAFRRSYYMGNETMSEEQMASDKAAIKDLREEFFGIISDSYQTKFT